MGRLMVTTPYSEGMMKRLLSCALLTLLITGCMSVVGPMPGDVLETVSEFDGTKQVEMLPVDFSPSVNLGLYWRTTMPPGKVVLQVQYRGVETFSGKGKVKLNIDGQFFSLDSLDSTTEFDFKAGYYNYGVAVPSQSLSTSRYYVTEDLVRDIIVAKKAILRIDLGTTFTESDLTSYMGWDCRGKLRDFLTRLQQARQGA